MINSKNVISKYNLWMNHYGNHLTITMHEEKPAEEGSEINAYGKVVAKVVYHFTTNSVTCNYIEKDAKKDDVLLEVVNLLRSKEFKSFMEASGEKFSFKPIWCKETNKHYN